jgi:hypothetical protein
MITLTRTYVLPEIWKMRSTIEVLKSLTDTFGGENRERLTFYLPLELFFFASEARNGAGLISRARHEE